MTSESRAPNPTSAGRRDRRPRPKVAISAAAAVLLSVRDLQLAIAGRRRHTTPNHVYTRALIAATPRHDRPGDLLQPVPEALAVRLNEEALAWDTAQRSDG